MTVKLKGLIFKRFIEVYPTISTVNYNAVEMNRQDGYVQEPEKTLSQATT